MTLKRTRVKKLHIISVVLTLLIMTYFSPVLASTSQNNTISSYDTLIELLNNDSTLTKDEYHTLLMNVMKENPAFLLTLNDQETDALAKIYKVVFDDLLMININKNEMGILFYGVELLADLNSLLHNVKVEISIEATPTLESDAADCLDAYISDKSYQQPIDRFTLVVIQRINQEQTRLIQADIPIRLLRYNLNIKEELNDIKALSILPTSLQEVESTVYSAKVVKIKTVDLDAFSLISTKKKEETEKKFFSFVDASIDSNRLIMSAIIIIAATSLIVYLLFVGLKIKKQVET